MLRSVLKLAAASTLLASSAVVSTASAAGGGAAPPFRFDADIGNNASIQRGAKYFMNYCAGCHSMEYLRYQRIAKDTGLSDDELADNLIFTGVKKGEHIISAMDPTDAEAWFGVVPPDLTLTARYKSPSWIYSYLLTFYQDDSRPMGSNNIMLPGASMPNVLWPLEGVKQLKVKDEHAEDEGHGGGHGPARPEFTTVTEGALNEAEFRRVVGDITNFMTYAAEPGKRDLHSLGIKVILYLVVLFILAWFLKKEFWKDVH